MLTNSLKGLEKLAVDGPPGSLPKPVEPVCQSEGRRGWQSNGLPRISMSSTLRTCECFTFHGKGELR